MSIRARNSRPSKGEVVVVTGATSGVGRAVAIRFARDGANVALLARGEAGLRAAAADAEREGGKALAVPTDVSEYDQVEAAARATEERFGPIDVWVNDAMTTVFAFLADIEPDEYEQATRVCYLGAVWGTKVALSRMLARDHGTIMQVGSALAYRGIPLQAPYCGAKHAIKGMTDSLRSELRAARSRVHVSMVQLPAVNTPQFDHCRSKFSRHPQPVPPIYQPEVAADAIHWAVRHRRRELWVGFPTVATILADRLAASLVDRYLGRTGVQSQLVDRPANAENRMGNLFEPAPGDPGAHGSFDARAHAHSPQQAFARHRGASLALGGALLGAAAAGRYVRSC